MNEQEIVHKQTFLQDDISLILCSPNHPSFWSTKLFGEIHNARLGQRRK